MANHFGPQGLRYHVRRYGTMAMRRWLGLFLLYLVQGLPFGFQSSALPLILRARGTSLSRIGLASALSAPWALKFLLAPPIESLVSSWATAIIPSQVMLLGLMAAAVLLDNDAQRIGALFLMNLVTAAMDVAVDGLAIDILDSDTEIGWGNVAQVVGFKTGMLTGGAFLLYVAGTSWSHCFGVMAVIALLATVGSFFVLLAGFSGNSVARIKSVPKEKFSVSTILKELWKTTVAGKQLWVLLAVFVYKSGEVVGDRMFKLFLFDINKFSPEEIAFWNSVVGMIFSIVGSTAGGKVVGEVGAVASVRLLAILSLMAQLVRYLVIVVPQLQVLSVIVSLVAFENLVGGALTVVMFAFMMDSVNRRIGASHFTMLATIEVWGKSIPSLLSGLLADRLGYAFTFLLNCGFSAFFVFVSFRLKQRQRLRAGNKQK